MKRVSILGKFLAVVVLVTGCCTARTNLLPQGPNEASIISTSSSSDCCLKKAKEEAEEYCTKKGKTLAVVDEKTDYQGADKSVKAAIGVVGVLTGKHAHADSAEDYRTTLKFKCQ